MFILLPINYLSRRLTVILEERSDPIEEFDEQLAQDFGASSPATEASRRKRKRSDMAETSQGQDISATLVRDHAANIPCS